MLIKSFKKKKNNPNKPQIKLNRESRLAGEEEGEKEEEEEKKGEKEEEKEEEEEKEGGGRGKGEEHSAVPGERRSPAALEFRKKETKK